eukprot:10783121-Lingulodinium_polyedra.AAC.1
MPARPPPSLPASAAQQRGGPRRGRRARPRSPGGSAARSPRATLRPGSQRSRSSTCPTAPF